LGHHITEKSGWLSFQHHQVFYDGGTMFIAGCAFAQAAYIQFQGTGSQGLSSVRNFLQALNLPPRFHEQGLEIF
jgi:hypothetical protein